MVPFTLGQALKACGGQYSGDGEKLNADISGVTIDSRDAGPGALFVAIRGERFDGHDFIEAAFAAGAACCVSERPPESGGPCILVPSTLDAFQAIAAFYRSLFPIPVVGISGSVGKTTTKELLAGVLAQKYRVLKNEGNLNNQTGVPITVFKLEPCHEAAVIEMGMNHFGEIRNLARIVRPKICVITNIGEAHIEFLGSREGILQAKTEMLEFMEPGGHIVVNGDDPLLAPLASRYSNVITIGFRDHNLARAEEIVDLGLRGTRFTVRYKGKRFPVYVPCPGVHMVLNALTALVVGALLGISEDQIQAGIIGYKPISGRMHMVEAAGITVINDAYNANPSSMAASLGILAKAEGRKVCILGDMFELGDGEARYHHDIGRYAADVGINCILCVGRLAGIICEGAREKGADARHFADKEQLLSALPSLIKPKDTVLVKASHGMRLDTVAEWLIENY
jgi:UDP-N-acetylmuramoyl-tripeptide--D-alanyl-D-alanine ligase